MSIQPAKSRRHKIIAMSSSPSPPSPEAPGLPGPAREDVGGAVVAEKQEQRVEPPKLYQVVMLNDDYTPMEFVVLVLQEHFLHDLETATQIMLKIHHEGRGICGVYSKDVAATKVELVQAAAKRAGHPLQCTLEAA
jgi:ATP-dependent Clp protease adaptor protein ClpS